MRSILCLVAALLAFSGCSEGTPSADPAPSPSAIDTTAAASLPAEFERRLTAACEESIRLSQQADKEAGGARELRLRSAQVVADALHAGEIPPEAEAMVDAYDIYFQESKRALEILDRSEPLEKRLKEAIAARDRAGVKEARAALEEAVRESQGIFQRATEAYGRFLDYLRQFGLTECSL